MVLENGTRIEADTVLFCTGYTLNLSFFNESIQKVLEFEQKEQLQPLTLYKCTFHPEFHNLGFVGVYRGPYWGVMELQARWISAVFSGAIDFPKISIETLNEERTIRTIVPRPQFPHADYVGLADDIAREIGCLPDFSLLQKQEPDLYRQLYKGPVVPVHYRFFENNRLIDEKAVSKFKKQLDEIDDFLNKKNRLTAVNSQQELLPMNTAKANDALLWKSSQSTNVFRSTINKLGLDCCFNVREKKRVSK